MKNILVIGSTGQIGSELTMKLRREIPGGTVVAGYIPGAEPKGELLESGPSALADVIKAESIADQLGQNAREYLDWYMSLPMRYAKMSASDIRYYFYQLQEVQEMMSVLNSKKAEQYQKAVESYYGAMAYTFER